MGVRLLGVTKRYSLGWRRNAFLTAVDGVTFEIATGEAVGLVGRNGSGKSTLLRLMAGITPPDEGTVSVEGRISAVLDLASGLHPLLSGRRNIALKGALHGLSARETRAREEAIIAFSGLEEYIDLPVRRFSTGMVIRLGFSIALHVDFDVLLMDEILSVGDLLFQRQALSRVREFLAQGKTLVLASHSLGEVASLCGRTVLLRQGRVVRDGGTEEVLQEYLSSTEREANRIPRHALPSELENPFGSDTGEVVIEGVSFLDGVGKPSESFRTGDPMSVAIRYRCRSPVRNPLFRVQFFRGDGLFVHGANTARSGIALGVLEGTGEMTLSYQRLNLLGGDYYVTVGVWPDEYSSALTDVAYDLRKWAHVVHIKSSREDGGGIVSNPFSWRHRRDGGGGG